LREDVADEVGAAAVAAEGAQHDRISYVIFV
jgi:hypothetical protein